MPKKIIPIRLEPETIEKADALVPFVRKREKPDATRSDVLRYCLDFGLDAMWRTANPDEKQRLF
jgi:hypothetical protein